MKKLLILLAALTVLASCKKDKENGTDETQNPLVFTSLTASDTSIIVTDVPVITAVATGDELQYVWSASYGSFIGSGSQVQWTVCHADTFRIWCKVKDKYGEEITKSVKMWVH